MRFPPECVRIIHENFKLKEKIHQKRIVEIEKDLIESETEYKKIQINVQTNQAFSLLSPQYRARMTKHILLKKNKNLNLTSPSQILDNSSFVISRENSALKHSDENHEAFLSVCEAIIDEDFHLKKCNSSLTKSSRRDNREYFF